LFFLFGSKVPNVPSPPQRPSSILSYS
jgi:hypothetical protein